MRGGWAARRGGAAAAGRGGFAARRGGWATIRRLLWAAAAATLMLTPAAAQGWARAKVEQSPRHHEWVTVRHGDRAVQVFIAYPQASEKRPAVLIIHEIFGMTDWAREVADEVAAAGYIAVAPDLLSGMGPGGGGSDAFPDQSARVKAVSELDPEQITADLDAAADYAEKLPSFNGQLMVAGFCWGGGQSFRYATHRPGLTADFVFYGPPPSPEAMRHITAPVYGFYAGLDARISATVPDATREMKAAGKFYQPVVYAGAGHGFMRAGEAPDATPGNRKAWQQAWRRWRRILARLRKR